MKRPSASRVARVARRMKRARDGTRRPRAVDLGDLRRLEPLSRRYGYDRGTPVDRLFIDDFLGRHGSVGVQGHGDIKGHVLEFGDDGYTRRFGGWDGTQSTGGAVTAVDILHGSTGNPDADLVGDLATAAGLADERYDCVICTQVVHVIYEIHAAVRTLHQVLRPGGVALVTFPGIAGASKPDRDLWGDYWRLTGQSARRLFGDVFGHHELTVETYGNVLAATAYLYGLAVEDLTVAELMMRDPDFETLIAVRARRAERASS